MLDPSEARLYLHNGSWSSSDDAWGQRKPDTVTTPLFWGMTTLSDPSRPHARYTI